MDMGSGSIDKTRVLDVKPLRSLAPIFPSGSDAASFSSPQSAPFVCVPPTGPFPPGVAPFYPFFVPTENHQNPGGIPNQGGSYPIHSAVPLTSFRTPVSRTNGVAGGSRRSARNRGNDSDEDGYGEDTGDAYLSSFSMHVADADDTTPVGKRKGSGSKSQSKSQRKTKSAKGSSSGPAIDLDAVANDFLNSFNLIQFETLKDDGDRESVGYILQIFDLLRRKFTQLEDSKEATPGATRRPDLKGGAILMSKGIRTNVKKRIGAVPGIEVGDIFFFRMELCLVGLHAPSMAGIDYMSVRITVDEEPVAVSIVSSGGYEDNGDDGDVLIYSGQGGNIYRKDKELMDQKLERGNLALEKSLHRGNDVRVIRGIKDLAWPTGKVYVYDGLYKIQESWAEKGKSGCNVFKYKLVRVPGQPEAFTLWKSIQQWRDGVTSRVGVILPDLTSGAENIAVSLVNDVDDEKGPAYFTYFSSLKYSKPFDSPKPSLSCNCIGGCQAGDHNCPCVVRNGGLSHTALGVLLKYKSLIHECGPSCACPPTCRNRITQAGLKVRLEVFKTKDKGWGLRSWDPIRGGAFICEYAGEVIDVSKAEELRGENEDNYIFDSTRTFEPLSTMPSESNEPQRVPFPLAISAKNGGNVARFMNHSCSPNVYWQPVLRETNNECYLHIAFYAIRHIPPMKELTYDYGMVRAERAGRGRKKCLCGSLKCKGYFY